MSEPVVRVKNLRRTFAGEHGDIEAVGGVDLELAPGTITVLIGPTGCGKSTVLRIIGGLDRVLLPGAATASVAERAAQRGAAAGTCGPHACRGA
jgi:ABC-type nitrate/sulfonate/bicarbonate transport system ATPase subunit